MLKGHNDSSCRILKLWQWLTNRRVWGFFGTKYVWLLAYIERSVFSTIFYSLQEQMQCWTISDSTALFHCQHLVSSDSKLFAELARLTPRQRRMQIFFIYSSGSFQVLNTQHVPEQRRHQRMYQSKQKRMPVWMSICK